MGIEERRGETDGETIKLTLTHANKEEGGAEERQRKHIKTQGMTSRRKNRKAGARWIP